MVIRSTLQMFNMAPNPHDVPDSPPKDLYIGAINPYALSQALLGRPIDEKAINPIQALSDVLQTDHNELFDMKYGSVLYAGLQLNTKENVAEPIPSRDMRILTEEDLVSPSLSQIKKLSDFEDKDIIENIGETRVREAWIHNGNLNLVLKPEGLVDKLSNSQVTPSVAEIATPFRHGDWNPPNATWCDMFKYLQNPPVIERLPLREVSMHNNPVQGAVGNSWLIAAIFAMAWANPSSIIHRTPATGKGEKHMTMIPLYSKGGRNDSSSEKVKVSDEILVNNSSHLPLYCHSDDAGDLYPALYEKAFAKWITHDSSDKPDVTQIAAGDPVKAIAQLNNKKPHYYFTSSRSTHDLYDLVRHNSVNKKTIYPMVAWTHGSHEAYKGSTLVGNHAYTVLGWTVQSGRPYIILRNPWAVTEPATLTTYPGLLNSLDLSFWQPITELSHEGVFALEAEIFKQCFAGLGVAK